MIRRPSGTATPAPTPDPQRLARAVRKVGAVYALGALVRLGRAEGA